MIDNQVHEGASGPGRRTFPSKLISAAETVKDQRATRAERPDDGVRNHEPAASPTQKSPRAQPVTFVHDQFAPRQPAFPAGQKDRQDHQSHRAFAQRSRPVQRPRLPLKRPARSKSQSKSPPVSQTNSPRLPSRLPERARIKGPTSARHPASVDRLESSARGGQVSLPRWKSRVRPQTEGRGQENRIGDRVVGGTGDRGRAAGAFGTHGNLSREPR